MDAGGNSSGHADPHGPAVCRLRDAGDDSRLCRTLRVHDFRGKYYDSDEFRSRFFAGVVQDVKGRL